MNESLLVKIVSGVAISLVVLYCLGVIGFILYKSFRKIGNVIRAKDYEWIKWNDSKIGGIGLCILTLSVCIFLAINDGRHLFPKHVSNDIDVDARSIVGTWSGVVEGEQMVFTFNSNGRCSVENTEAILDGTYEIDGKTIYLKLAGEVNTQLTISSLSGDKLIMDGVEFTRQGSHANGAVTQQERNVDANNIEGTWRFEKDGEVALYMTFDSNGRFEKKDAWDGSTSKGTYSVDGETLTVNVAEWGGGKETVPFTLEGNKLILHDGAKGDMVLTRIK